ncbi:MAG: imidazoleglycerol-phosphate dehydratase HisB [SAR324 cluster bacterium]|nr:imidazoleglycerol-phosphate dehydratase HisB [SAR324 cluster bacterium]
MAGNRMTARKAKIEYATKETRGTLALNLDGKGKHKVDTGIAYLDHMLEQLTFHGLLDLDLRCKGDLEVDSHHTVEDVALALGRAIDKALGERKGIRRYGHCYYPMDETLVRAVLDLSGRPEFHFQGEFRRPALGGLHTEMIPHFFKSVANAGRLTLHMAVLYGENDHHKCEGLFKAFARALSEAVSLDPRRAGVASTKGKL